MVECHLAKVDVASSNLVSRSSAMMPAASCKNRLTMGGFFNALIIVVRLWAGFGGALGWKNKEIDRLSHSLFPPRAGRVSLRLRRPC